MVMERKNFWAPRILSKHANILKGRHNVNSILVRILQDNLQEYCFDLQDVLQDIFKNYIFSNLGISRFLNR